MKPGNKPMKPRNYLSGNTEKDLHALRIKGTIKNPQTKAVSEVDETPVFVTYLTLALGNLSDIVGQDLTGLRERGAVEKALRDSGKLRETASFLWMFRENDPDRDYGKACGREDYEELAVRLVVQLWELRNMFVHPDKGSRRALTVPPEFFRFVEGELYGEAREHALGGGRRSEKAFKLKLFVPHDDDRTEYEFTRKGIVFLVCLALYAHDAHEFLQQFKDFMRAPRERDVEDGLEEDPGADAWAKLRKAGSSTRALHDAFTHFSMRAGRTDFDVQDSNYLNFANILLYLNKVPGASYACLALREEAEALEKAAAESTESDANKRFKYLLHPRLKDRFLTLALAAAEDFHKLDSLRFKRLDITVRPDRKRYLYGPIPEGQKNEFGEELHDANGMDRHYAIRNGVAAFEYVPEKHYGDIRIERLRGGIGENELARLLLAAFGGGGGRRRKAPGAVLGEYLEAYHRILERMLNAQDLSALTLGDPQFGEDFKTVSGKGDDALAPERFTEEMKPFFPESITRYFAGKGGKPGADALRDALRRRLGVMENHANDFLTRLDTLTAWKRMDAATRGKKPPLCPVGELKYPPRTSSVNDAELIRAVLRYLNLHLTPEDKYRQLPRGMRHRGVRDYEFQLLHRDIGNFAAKPDNLWRTLEKRDSLNGEDGPLELLKDRERELFKAEEKRCRGKVNSAGRPLQPQHTLSMLAAAATELYAEHCRFLRRFWCDAAKPERDALLPSVCARHGVRTGMDLDRDALVKAILGIDLHTWSRAYDYDKRAPREGKRTLAGAPGLVAAQIPVPNGIAARCFAPEPDGTPFRFNPAFRAFAPYEKGRMALRGWYDVSPLIQLAKAKGGVVPGAVPGLETRGGQEAADGTFGKLPPAEAADFSRTAVDKAIQAIQKAERQDKLLLACAKDYWDAFMASEVKGRGKSARNVARIAEMASIADFFSTPSRVPAGGVEIETMPNDFARPAFQSVVEHVGELVRSEANPAGAAPIGGSGNVYAFYDLWLALRDLQAREKRKRLAFVPAIVRFEAAMEPRPTFYPDSSLPQEEQKKEITRGLAAHCRQRLRQKCPDAEPLSDREYTAVETLRNRLFHPARSGKSLLSADFAAAEPVLRRFKFLGKLEILLLERLDNARGRDNA